MHYVYSFLKTINYELGHLASSLDSNGWAIIAVAAVAVGTFLLRGNMIRST